MLSMKAKFRLSVAALGMLSAGSAFGQTLTMTDPSVSPGATAQSVQFDYTAGGDAAIIITNINLTDTNAILSGVTYQQFNAATSAFVTCDGTFRNASTAGPFVRIACSATGRYTIQTLDPTVDPLPSFTNLARALFDIAGGATAGQTATFSYAPNCAAGQFPNVDNCTEFTTTAAVRVAGTVSDTGTVTVSAVPVPLTLSYSPAAGTPITFAAGGNVGAAAPNQTITATATGTSGTASLTGCAISGAGAAAFSVNPTSLNFPAAGSADLTLGCTHQAAAASATLTCSETDADSAAVARTWSLSCPAGNVPNTNPTITSNPAAGGTLTVSGGNVGNQGTGTIDFTAAGGSGTGSTTINCTATGAVQIALAPATPAGTTANQTVTGSNAAIDVRVGVVLTASAQTPAGTVSCDITPAGGATTTSVFTINAPAGIVFVPPEIIPSASTWSKIALFGLLGLFGMMAVGFRRQG